MTICLVDTSILTNMLRIPGKSDDHEKIKAELERLATDRSVVLLLPFAAIVETGNHTAQAGDGRQKRACAKRFVEQITKALDGQAPWTVTPMPAPDEVRGWLARFPDEAMRGLGIADLSIVMEWERQLAQARGRRVYIWSLDAHLQGRDRKP